MISGSQVLEIIRDQMNHVSSQYESLKTKLTQADGEIGKLTDERVEIFTKLATLYLPQLDAQSIKDKLPQLYDAVQEQVQQRQARREEIGRQISSNDGERTQIKEEIESISKDMNAASEQRASLEAEAHKTLTLNEHYTTLKAEADDLQRKFDGNEAWLERYVAMADEQLKLFQADKKFMYLVNSGYDPANRGKRGLKAIFDDRVARSVNFEENKDHYDKLISRPKEMKEELDRRRAALDEKLTELRGIEKGVEDQLGLTPLLEAGDKVDAKRKDAMDRLSQHDADYEALVTKLAELDTVNSPFYIKAKEDLKLFLRGQKISDLLEMARKTPSPEDDNLVQRLGEIDEAEKKIKGGASGLIAERESWNEKLANLKRLEAAFCKKDFESYRSVFVDDFNIEQLLNYYIAGQKNPSTGQAYTVDDIWMEVQEHHRLNAEEQPRYNPSYPSSYPVPRVGPVIMVPGVGGHRSPPPRPHDWGSSSGPHSSPSPRPSSPSRPSSPRPSSPSPRPSSPTHFGGSSGGRIGGFSSSGGGRVGGFGKH